MIKEEVERIGQKKRPWIWLILLAVGLGIILLPFPVSAAEPTQRTFHIEASRFEYSPGVIRVNPGDRVTIELSATDVVHGLAIDGYGLSTTADPGQPAVLSFIADRQGTYRFRCTTTCGNLHPFMIGKLEVGHNTLLWRAIGLSGLILLAGAYALQAGARGLLAGAWMVRK